MLITKFTFTIPNGKTIEETWLIDDVNSNATLLTTQNI